MLAAAAGDLFDTLPRKYCIDITVKRLFIDWQTRHEVYFWKEVYMEYRQLNSRKCIPFWWEKRTLKEVKMLYNRCYDAPQPYVADRNLTNFYFTKNEFAAMRHYDEDDTLQFVINGELRKLRRCKIAWEPLLPSNAITTYSPKLRDN
ncbi:hypothetical protein FOL47_006533 [Perkinsus chesapeaki]|uniref:Uncharacterized protein n=1 Tax=Perkinsus chesapeaki TaxID=330153 RepID=A0A7J6LR85_PERCH|nr:hypothetical protein FOL47_006533 [Perkinsus chesapeaki]